MRIRNIAKLDLVQKTGEAGGHYGHARFPRCCSLVLIMGSSPPLPCRSLSPPAPHPAGLSPQQSPAPWVAVSPPRGSVTVPQLGAQPVLL